MFWKSEEYKKSVYSSVAKMLFHVSSTYGLSGPFVLISESKYKSSAFVAIAVEEGQVDNTRNFNVQCVFIEGDKVREELLRCVFKTNTNGQAFWCIDKSQVLGEYELKTYRNNDASNEGNATNGGEVGILDALGGRFKRGMANAGRGAASILLATNAGSYAFGGFIAVCKYNASTMYGVTDAEGVANLTTDQFAAIWRHVAIASAIAMVAAHALSSIISRELSYRLNDRTEDKTSAHLAVNTATAMVYALFTAPTLLAIFYINNAIQLGIIANADLKFTALGNVVSLAVALLTMYAAVKASTFISCSVGGLVDRMLTNALNGGASQYADMPTLAAIINIVRSGKDLSDVLTVLEDKATDLLRGMLGNNNDCHDLAEKVQQGRANVNKRRQASVAEVEYFFEELYHISMDSAEEYTHSDKFKAEKRSYQDSVRVPLC